MGKRNKDKRRYPDLPDPLPVPVIDNHTHLPCMPGDDQEWRPEGGVLSLEQHIIYMQESGVLGAITCACAVPDLEAHVQAANDFPNKIWAALAIHPNEAPLHGDPSVDVVIDKSPDGLTHKQREWHSKYSLEEAISLVADLAKNNKSVVAIGESGLDYFRTAASGKEKQKQSFRAHIALAKELGIPLQIHDREAHEDCVEVILADGAPETTIFHCFSGDRSLAQKAAEHGWYCSFAGPITYPANDELRRALQLLPKELILCETDAPYLSPVPWRGYPNAPYVMNWTVRAQAEIRQMELEKWCEQLLENTNRAYGI